MKKALNLGKNQLRTTAVALAAVLLFALPGVVSAQTVFDDSLELTQTTATIGVNQRITVVSFNGTNLKVSGGGKIVKASVAGGNQVSIYGLAAGNATIKVCSENLGCRNLVVKVQRAKVNLFRLSTSNVSVKGAQEIGVSTYNGKSVSAKINSGNAKVRVSAGKVYITGERAGSATVTVCSTNLGCLPIYVKVTSSRPVIKAPANSGTGTVNNGTDVALKLNTQNVSVQEGKSYDVIANISSGLTAESNSGAVRTAVNSNRVTIYGTYIGSASVKVCKPGKNCVAVSVTVTRPDPSYTNVTGDLRVSDSKIEIMAGSKAWVSVSGGSKLKVYTSNSYIAKPTLKGNLVLITTFYAGKATVTVCSEDDGCVLIEVLSKTSTLKKVTGTMRTIDQPKGTTKTYNFNYYNTPTTYYIQNTTNNNLLSVGMQPGNPFNLVISTYEVGTSIITICPYVSTYKCGTVGVNITDPVATDPTQKISLSDNLMTVVRGQTASVTANMNYSMAAFSDNEAVRTAVNGSQITLYGVHLGAGNVTVCSTNGTCANVYVRVVEPGQE